MKPKRPHILIINDDGVHAPGIRYLYNAIKEQADCTVVAPLAEKSGAALSLTLTKPLKISPVVWEGAENVFHVNGTPADCVKLALNSLLKIPPDLIVSGINRGSNAGRNVLYSGTVGAVIEGLYRNNVPGIAFSCSDFENPNYGAFTKYIFPIVEHFLKHPLPQGSFVNVNFPSPSKERVLGVKMAKQGKGFWTDRPDRRIHPGGDPYFWLGGTWKACEEEEESDVRLLEEGYVTCVPIYVNELTDSRLLQYHKPLFESLFNSLPTEDLNFEELS